MHRPTPADIQKRKLKTLERLLDFAEGRRSETRDTLAKTFAAALSISEPSMLVAAPRPGFDIDALRSWLRAGMIALADGRRWEITSLELGDYSIDVGRGIVDHTGQALPKLALLTLLDGEAWRIRRCAYPACGKIFVARKLADFCSLACGQVVRQMRKFDAPRARKLEELTTAAAAQMKEQLYAERLLAAECPRLLDAGQHLGEGFEHRLAPSQRVICAPLSDDTGELPYSRGWVLWTAAWDKKKDTARKAQHAAIAASSRKAVS